MAASNRAYSMAHGFYEPLFGSMMGHGSSKTSRAKNLRKYNIPIYFIRYATLLYVTLVSHERKNFV